MRKLLLLIGFASLTMNAQVPIYVPTNGLVAYYPLDGNANDLSGNGYNGTNNGATLTTDRFGNSNNAFNFNGSSNFIQCILPTSISSSNGLTLSGWTNSISYSQSPPQVIVFFTDPSNTGYAINYGNGNGTTGFLSGQCGYAGVGAAMVVKPTTPPSPNNWYYVVMTCDFSSNTSKLYINGILQSQSTNNLIAANLNKIVIGKAYNSNWFQNGKLDDIGIWNRPLTSNEITTLYYADSCQSLIINTGVLSYNPPKYNNTITIYPNPAQDQITIDCGTLTNVVGYHLEIVNTLGQVVFNQPMNKQQYKVALNTWSGKGIYFVKIYDASNNLLNTKKIILQ